MILLASPFSLPRDVAPRLEQAVAEPVQFATSLAEALQVLRSNSFNAVIVDPHLLELAPSETEVVFAHLGWADFIEINLAITGMDRLIHVVQHAIKRRAHNRAVARNAVVSSLRNNLNDALTTLLLDCGLAVEVPQLPAAAAEKLASMRESIEKLRAHLEIVASN